MRERAPFKDSINKWYSWKEILRNIHENNNFSNFSKGFVDLVSSVSTKNGRLCPKLPSKTGGLNGGGVEGLWESIINYQPMSRFVWSTLISSAVSNFIHWVFGQAKGGEADINTPLWADAAPHHVVGICNNCVDWRGMLCRSQKEEESSH